MIEYPETTRPAAELEPMRGVELVYFVIPDAWLWSAVNVLYVLDGPVDFELLKNRVASGYGRFERLMQRPVRKGKIFYWETVDSIAIDDHVHMIPDTVSTQSQVSAMVGRFLTDPLDPSRPLWDVHYIPNYEDGAAVLLRIHHAYGDGRSLQAIATSITALSLDESRDAAPVAGPTVRHQAVADSIRPTSRRGPRVESSGGWLAASLFRLGRFFKSIRKMLSAFKKDRETGFDAVPTEEKVAAFSGALSRSELRQASTALGCTLNDLVLSGVSGAIRNHLLRTGKNPHETRMTVSIPVDLHSPRSLANMTRKGILTNHLGTISIQLPVGIADGAERARLLAAAMTEGIDSGEALMQYKSLSSFHKMPQGLLVRMFRSQAHKLSGIISNLPGPKKPGYLAGSTVRSWLFWVVAAQLAGSHLGVSVTHYVNEIRLGLTLPANAGYHADELIAEMVAEIEQLAASALEPSSTGG